MSAAERQGNREHRRVLHGAEIEARGKGATLVQDLADKCNRCHGGDAENPAMVVPKIGGQDQDYLVMALRAYRDDRRESSMMTG